MFPVEVSGVFAIRPVTRVPATVGGVAEVGAAAQGELAGATGSEPVGGPLPDVAGGVEQAEAVGLKASTGAVPTNPSAAVFCTGKAPCQTFMRWSPSGSSWSPHGNGPTLETATRRELPLRLTRQSPPCPGAERLRVAPGDVDHGVVAQPVEVRARPVRVTPIRPGDVTPPLRADHGLCRRMVVGSRPANTNDDPNRSASVTCPVAVTNSAKRSLVTVTDSIANAASSTVWIGPS